MEEDRKIVTLDALLRRREVVSALYQRRRLKSVTSVAHRPDSKAVSPHSTSRESILSNTSGVIEDSDFESSAKPSKKKRKILDSYSSNCEDTINTSMISLPLTHPYFGGPATPIKKPVKNKIEILSNQIIENMYEKRQNEQLLLSSSPISVNVNYLDINVTPSTSNETSSLIGVCTNDPGLEQPVREPDTDLTTVDIDPNITTYSIEGAITEDPSFPGQVDEYVVINASNYNNRAEYQVSPSLINNEHTVYSKSPAVNDVDTDHSTQDKSPQLTKVIDAANMMLPALDVIYTDMNTKPIDNEDVVDSVVPAQDNIDTDHNTYTKSPGLHNVDDTVNPELPAPNDIDTGTTMKTPSINNNDVADSVLPAQDDVETDLDPKIPSMNSDNAAVSPSTSNKVTKSVKAKKRHARVVKNNYLDFLSDDDIGDYSAGSSDYWTEENDYESSEDETYSVAKKNKKTKKIEKPDVNLNKKKIKKINKRKLGKKNKEEGKEYETKTGKCMPEKKMQANPCLPNKCKRGCYDITEERRTSIFNFYWSLEAQRRKDWLVRNSHIINCARKRTDTPISRRNVTYDYYVNNGEGHQKVCQKFLLCTLDISQKFLLYTLKNCKDEVAQKDQRKCNTSNKYSDITKAKVREFIEKLPAVPSHYNRQRTNKVYLPQELKNISNIYRLYVKECRSSNIEYVSESTFRGIFQNEYNISFHSPKKDKCIICVKAEHNECLDEKEKDSLQEHLNEKKATYKRFKQHQHLPLTKKDTVVCTFDLQKILNTPYGESVVLYYSRKYPIFNFTLYESISQEVFCYVWGECDAKRGANEIATLLYSYLKHVDNRGIKNLLLYCDSCPGQNKNKTILAVLNYFLMKSTHVEVIQINYLLPGHTYMPVDSVHATIEREVKKLTVWSPTQWPSYIEAARKNPKPYNVNVMEHSDFLNWDEITAETFTNETCKGLKIRNVRIVTMKKKHPNEIYIKYSMEDNTPTVKVTLFQKPIRKGKGRGKGKSRSRSVVSEQTIIEYAHEKVLSMSPAKLYTNKLQISNAKYRDLKNLCNNGVIPKRYHNDFLQLPHGSDVADTLTLTDEEDEEDTSD